MFCSGKFPLWPHVSGSFPLSLLLDLAYPVLYKDPWYIWSWALYRGNKKRSICILLHAGSQLSQHHLLKMVYFSPLDGFGFSVKDQVTIGVTIGMWIYFRFFNSSPLICLSLYQSCGFNYYCSVVHLEVRDGDSTRRSFIVENSFHYPGILLFQWSWELLFLSLWRIELEVWWGLQWICRLLLVRCPFFSMSVVPIHECQRDFHLLMSSSVSFSRDLKFLSYRSFPCLLRVTPRYFISFMITVKGVLSQVSFAACLSFKQRKATDLLILYPATLLKLFIIYKCSLMEFFGMIMYTIISSTNSDILTSSFPVCISISPFVV